MRQAGSLHVRPGFFVLPLLCASRDKKKLQVLDTDVSGTTLAPKERELSMSRVVLSERVGARLLPEILHLGIRKAVRSR